MATYLQGVTDIFPEDFKLQLDWNNMQRTLMLKDAAYEQGAKKVRSLYDSLFNSAMLRTDNIEARDKYLKEISEGLKSISATDLSIDRNVENAYGLFRPLNENPLIVKDIAFTKNYQTELSRAEQLRLSSDPATRKQYWDTGVKALQYQAEEFRNADSNTAMGMSSPKYVGNIDFMAMADKLYKDAGIEVTEDKVKGGYIWTMKNGDIAVPLTQTMVNTMLSQDPAVADMLKTQAYVQRKDFIKQNAARFGGKENVAEAVYLQKVTKGQTPKFAASVTVDEKELTDLRTKKDEWDNLIRTKGIVPDSEDHKKYMEVVQRLQLLENSVEQKKGKVLPSNMVDLTNVQDLRNYADNLVSATSFNTIADQLAKYMAYKKSSVSVKADPFSLAQYRSNLSLGVQKTMEGIRQQNKKDLTKWKYDNGYVGGDDDGDGTSTNTGGGINGKINSETNELLEK